MTLIKDNGLQKVVKRRKKRGIVPTHLHCQQKTFWLDNDLNAYLQKVTTEIGVSQNYFVNAILRRFKSGDLDWSDPVFRKEIDIQS